MNALDFKHAYRVELLSLGDNIGLLSGVQSPTGLDTTDIPVGSVFFQTDGTVWRRISDDASGWMKLSTMPFFFFLLADSTVVFIPWSAPGKISLVLADSTSGTLMVEI